MNLLVLDTSTKSTVLGLRVGDEVIDRTSVPGASHSREILPSVQALVETAGIGLKELDAIVFGQGPGSFTGLRISVGVVQGLGYGLDIPLVPVSSMAALAQALAGNSAAEVNVFVALTARLEEIYFGAYQLGNGVAVEVASEGVEDVSRLPQMPEGHWVGAGNAWGLKDKIESSTGISVTSIHDDAVPSVQGLLDLGMAYLEAGQTVTALEASPVYLREEVAQKNP